MRRIYAAAIGLLLLQCNGGVTLPNPMTPTLQIMNINGTCTPSTSCALPTAAATSWDLTPLLLTKANGDQVWNRRVIVVVDVPALTDLQLSYTAHNQTHAMVEAPTPWPPDPVHYGTDHTDIGLNQETRRWFLHIATSPCDNPATFHIVDVGRQPGAPMSAPLDVTLNLSPGGGCGTGGGPPPMYSSSGSSSGSTSSGGSSKCPSGEQLFKICEKCQASAGATPIYHYYEACYTSWQVAQTVHGAGSCPITQVSGPSQCP